MLPCYIRILINQYKDPYLPTRIMESRRTFFSVAHMCSKFVVFRDFTSHIREDLKESTKKKADILNRIMQKWSFLFT